jgi:hypothetical protein
VSRLALARSIGLCAALLGACKGGGGAGDGGAPYPRDWSAHPAVARLSGAKDIVALGDVHGDPDVTLRLLAAAGLVTKTAPTAWSGGATILVVTGDVIDKGDSALPVIELLRALEPEARAAGGRVVVTLGNHEAEFLAAPTDDKTSVFQAELRAAGLDPIAVAAGQGPVGAWLHELPVAALVDDWFFCHSGDSEGRTSASIAKKFTNAVDGPAGYGDDFVVGMGSILEANAWWEQPSGAVATLDAYLAALPAKHIVFGHDPGELTFPDDPKGTRARGELAARYAGRLFLIDVGASYAVGASAGAVLHVSRGATSAADTADAIFVDGTTAPLWP